MVNRILESKTRADGSSLLLAEDEKGERILLEDLNLSVSWKELDLIKDIRATIQKLSSPENNALLTYKGVEKYKGRFYLVLPFVKELWENWDNRQEISVEDVVEAGKVMLKTINIIMQQGAGLGGIFHTDLARTGDRKWVVLDPRIRSILAPYRPTEELRGYILAPEVIKGSGWDIPANIYTVGLTMYYLAAGIFPYPLGKKEVTMTAIIRELPVNPRFHRPDIGEKLSKFIMRALLKKPELRPSLDEAMKILDELSVSGGYKASPEEMVSIKKEAEVVIKKAEKKRKLFWLWQRWKWPAAVITVILLVVIFTGRSGYQEVITKETKPRQVVEYFYDALGRLDIMQLEETLAKGVGKEFRNIVTNIHVISKMRMAYEGRTIPLLMLEGLNISTTAGADSSAEKQEFRAEYKLKIAEGEKYLVQERKDRLTLGKIKDEWRIINLHSEISAETREPVSETPESQIQSAEQLVP